MGVTRVRPTGAAGLLTSRSGAKWKVAALKGESAWQPKKAKPAGRHGAADQLNRETENLEDDA